jgi:hypothetical protein
MPRPKQYRSIDVLEQDGVLPMEGMMFNECLRAATIVQVLLQLPDDDYETIKAALECDVSWFIPDYNQRGMVYPFFATVYPEAKEGSTLNLAPHAPVIYFSPILERESRSIRVAVVAHELAHIALKHSLIPNGDEYEIQENEAWELTRKWGFQREIKILERKHKEAGGVGL